MYWYFVYNDRIKLSVRVIKMFPKSKSAQKSKDAAFKNKISAVNSYIRQKQSLPETLFLNAELLKHLKMQKPVYEINNTLKLKQTQTILFSSIRVVMYEIVNEPLDSKRNYCINLNPSSQIIVELILNNSVDSNVMGKQKKKYHLNKPQGIIISEKNWEKAHLIIEVKKANLISSVKITLDTIQTEFKTKMAGSVSQKNMTKKIVEEYLDKNLSKEKVKQIIDKRRRQSLTRLEPRSNTCFSGMRSSMSCLNDTKTMIRSAQGKRDLIKFEHTKQQYLKHFQKMSPQKSFYLKKYQNEYSSDKHIALANFSKIVCLAKIISTINVASIKIENKKIKSIMSNLLCKRFIKNMYKANKMRMSIRNRNRTSCHLNLGAISCLIYPKTIQKAQNRILDCFGSLYFKNTVSKMAQRSSRIKEAVRTIQRQYLKYRERLKVKFVAIVKAKQKQFYGEQEQNKCFHQYILFCTKEVRKQPKKKLQYNFVRNHKYIDELLAQLRENQTTFTLQDLKDSL